RSVSLMHGWSFPKASLDGARKGLKHAKHVSRVTGKMTVNRREFLLAIAAAASTRQDLISRWKVIAHQTDGTVGIAALHLGTGRLLALNGDERFPLASVCKVPIAMHTLALVDEGKLSVNQDIEVLPRDVWSGVSQIAPRWPNQKRFRLGEML